MAQTRELVSARTQPAQHAVSLPEREKQALLRVSAAAAGASGLEDVLELAAEEALKAVGAASLSVSRCEPGEQAIRTLLNVGELGPSEDRHPPDETYPFSDFPLVEKMAQNHLPYFNSIDDADCDPAARAVLLEHGKSSDLGVPILVEGECWGEIWATKAIGELPFRGEDVSFLERIAGQFAIAIARAELFSQVSRLAYEDALTGLPNRRALDERLERSLSRGRSTKTPVAMVLCDLDDLKRINDSRGHDAGDQALRMTAQAIVASAADQPGAFVARISGDEFCVLLEGHGLDAAVALGAAALDRLADGIGADFTMSCGAAMTKDDHDAPSLLKEADAALYAAKRSGGGRVCSTAQTLPQPQPRRRHRDRFDRQPVAIACAEILASLEGRLAQAPLLDRLEEVASAFTTACNLAAWTISRLNDDGEALIGVAFGDTRASEAPWIRLGPGTQRHMLTDYPATAAVLRAGSGFFYDRVGEPGADPKETALLADYGFRSVLGLAARDSKHTYLLELFGDDSGDLSAEVVTPLRLAVMAAQPTERIAFREPQSSASNLPLLVARRLDDSSGLDDAATTAAEELQRAFGARAVHIVHIDGVHLELRAEAGPSITPPDWVQGADAGIIGRCLREGAPVIVSDVRRDPQFRGNPATRTVRSELVVPVRVGGRLWGAINVEHEEPGFFEEADLNLIAPVAAQLGGALHAIELYASLEKAYVGTAEALSAALEAKDPYTAEHSDSIAVRAIAVGKRLGLEAEELRVLRFGAALHDIGKLGVRRSVLQKPGPLTAEEYESVKEHPVIGERILAPIEFLKPVLPLVRHAHERWDGAGYPDGLSGAEIPLGARIIFACDACDAMTTDRPYRAAMSDADAQAELEAHAGTQFDPKVVEALLAVMRSS